MRFRIQYYKNVEPDDDNEKCYRVTGSVRIPGSEPGSNGLPDETCEAIEGVIERVFPDSTWWDCSASGEEGEFYALVVPSYDRVKAKLLLAELEEAMIPLSVLDTEQRLFNLKCGGLPAMTLTYDVYSERDDWVSEDEKQKAIEANCAWRLLWYPTAESRSVSATSLKAVIDAAEKA
jgi:hypothetical protein